LIEAKHHRILGFSIVKKIKYAEFKLLAESNSLEVVEVVRDEKEQVWNIVATTKGKQYQLALESRDRSRRFSSLENACKCLVKAGCRRFEVDAMSYLLDNQVA